MKLVILFGPAAVGKMTVGHELARTTGLKLFHNHRSIDLVLNFFEYGTSEFWRLDSMFRSKIFDAVAAGELPGLIFTYMWALNEPGDKSYIDDLANKFSDRGGTVYYVELRADLEIRLKRNKGVTRLEQKPSKRNLAASEAMLLRHDKEFQQNTSEQRPFFYKSNFLKIDNTTLAAVEVAAIIKDKFDL
ncbi:MAG: AAA family ATPase [Xanthobacteraceae bacterium]